MTDADHDDLTGFHAEARRALIAAEHQARDLGHDRVGTEHLLLGLVGADGGTAATLLADAGITLAAARHQVVEAVGPTDPARSRRTAPLPRTARASRALGRAVRFSHDRRADAVTTEHLLLGVLDVEGTAGQVLRKLGVEPARLRALVAPADSGDNADEPADDAAVPLSPPQAPIWCPTCRADLTAGIVHRRVTAPGDDGNDQTGPDTAPIDVVLVACAACGTALGAVSRPTAP